jgi:arginase
VRPVRDQNVVLIDARDLDPAERDALAASRFHRVGADPETLRSVVDRLAGTAVYLHIDVDIVDGADLPGLRFPVGAGPTLSRVEECVTEIVAVTQSVAACIACTWSPERIRDEAAQRAITRLARVIGAELRWPASGAAA